MNEQEKQTIRDICEKTGDNYVEFWDTKSGQRELLGWLCEKETQIAIFGEEKNFEEHCGRCECMDDNGIPEWRYHDSMMSGMTAKERLAYYARFSDKCDDSHLFREGGKV